MSEKMLIDATHPEETRVAVIKDNKLIKYESENANRKPLRNNIYLAKIIRVEPSLQAAFVEYGGARHGFLAFDEIHPDYYQIPAEDKQKLLDLQEDAEEEEEISPNTPKNHPSEDHAINETSETHEITETNETLAQPHDKIDDHDEDPSQKIESTQSTKTDIHDSEIHSENKNQSNDGTHDTDTTQALQAQNTGPHSKAIKETPKHTKSYRHRYKIQEVIKKRQIILVQVTKEERGNKGAALTTYLSLAGKYTVLMPNTAKGRGLSRKIQSQKERKKLVQISQSLEVPQTMGLIIRTAGENHTKTEIKRDYEYLLRIWNNIRELTLNSIAPTLVHQEGSIIKRSIRDEYDKTISEVLVAGEEAYKEARLFMELFMPSSKKNIKKYKELEPIMIKHGIEGQIDTIYSSVVPLESGGYIVIDKTEAVTAVDVNSGGATKERNIENTALNTNIEAAKEIVRQLKLRDMAGLIVIDFIDMDLHSNNRIVEKQLKQSLASDRARIHVGRISQFGLLEMSRQRLRLDVIEDTAISCPHCKGKGIINTVTAMAIRILRAIEVKAHQNNHSRLIILANEDVTYYILNTKRTYLADIEKNTSSTITIKLKAQAIISDFTIHVEKLSSENSPTPIEEDEKEITKKENTPKRTNSKKQNNYKKRNTHKNSSKKTAPTNETVKTTNDTHSHIKKEKTNEIPTTDKQSSRLHNDDSKENITKTDSSPENKTDIPQKKKNNNRKINTKRQAKTAKDLVDNRRKRKKNETEQDVQTQPIVKEISTIEEMG